MQPLRAFLARVLRATDPHDSVYGLARSLMGRIERDTLTPAALDEAASELHSSGDFLHALELLEVTLGCTQVLLDPTWVGPLERWRGVVLFRLGHHQEAIIALESAHDAYRTEHDPVGLSRTQSDLGTVLASLCRWPEARRAFARAVMWAREAGREDLEARANFNAAIGAHKVGRWRDTASVLRRMRPFMATCKERRFAVNYLVEVAQTFRHLGFPRAAIRVGAQAYELASRPDPLVGRDVEGRKPFRRGQILALAAIGEAQLDLGRVSRALTVLTCVLRESLEVAPEGDLAVAAFRQMAEACAAAGDFQRARRMVRYGLRLAERQTDHTEWIALTRVETRLLIAQGRMGAGVDRLMEAIDRSVAQGLRFEEAACRELLGFHHQEHGIPRQSERNLASARRIYRDLGFERHRRALAAGRRVGSGLGPTGDIWKLVGVDTISECYRSQLEAIHEHLLNPGFAALVLEGEPGVGKRHLATRLHDMVRPGAALVWVSCAGLPSDLSAPAGDRDATLDLAARFASGRAGTILLERVDRLTPEQARWVEAAIRSLCEGRGGPILLATTGQALDRLEGGEALDSGLLALLGTERLTVPPLRERPLDIVPLCVRILDDLFSRQVHDPPRIAGDAIELLVRYGWRRGNVRELKHALRGATLLSKGGRVLEARHFPSFDAADPTSSRPPSAEYGT